MGKELDLLVRFKLVPRVLVETAPLDDQSQQLSNTTIIVLVLIKTVVLVLPVPVTVVLQGVLVILLLLPRLPRLPRLLLMLALAGAALLLLRTASSLFEKNLRTGRKEEKPFLSP
jgi:uncharacterized membrane protein YphA (DoxX/SURF4 family)